MGILAPKGRGWEGRVGLSGPFLTSFQVFQCKNFSQRDGKCTYRTPPLIYVSGSGVVLCGVVWCCVVLCGEPMEGRDNYTHILVGSTEKPGVGSHIARVDNCPPVHPPSNDALRVDSEPPFLVSATCNTSKLEPSDVSIWLHLRKLFFNKSTLKIF